MALIAVAMVPYYFGVSSAQVLRWGESDRLFLYQKNRRTSRMEDLLESEDLERLIAELTPVINAPPNGLTPIPSPTNWEGYGKRFYPARTAWFRDLGRPQPPRTPKPNPDQGELL